MAVRRLIVNADDFGLTPGINRAIIEAHRSGIVTSATLMANSGAFDEAVRLAQANPNLGVGCHVVLIDGQPLLPPEKIPTLVTSRAQLERTPAALALKALRGRLNPEEIRAEAEAQIRKIQGAGLTVTHIDTHKHAHTLPQVLRPLLEAARACGIRAIRAPFEPLHALPFSQLLRHPKLWGRHNQIYALRVFAASFRECVGAARLTTTGGTLGMVVTGSLTQELFERIVRCAPEGTSEFVCHPGYDDAALADAGTKLRRSREQELEILKSPATRAALQRMEIELINYAALARPAEVTSSSIAESSSAPA
jgi:hopanoid biosynthesis associated protein HpnK